jgi:hypothetical protein
LLLDAGADPNAPGPRGGTALARLAYCEEMPDELRFPLFEMLLKAGANPHQDDKDGSTAIKWAQIRKNERVLKLLQEAPASPPAASRPAAAKKTGKSAPSIEPDGAADFHELLSQGEEEWAVLAIKAPIDAVTAELERMLPVKTIARNVTIKTTTKETDEIAPGIPVVEITNSKWTIVLRSLFHLDEQALAESVDIASKQSAALGTQAIVYMNHGASDAAAYTIYQNGTQQRSVDEADEASADRFFAERHIYLPACYPKSKGKNSWLAVEKRSAKRISRADIIVVREAKSRAVEQ